MGEEKIRRFVKSTDCEGADLILDEYSATEAQGEVLGQPRGVTGSLRGTGACGGGERAERMSLRRIYRRGKCNLVYLMFCVRLAL